MNLKLINQLGIVMRHPFRQQAHRADGERRFPGWGRGGGAGGTLSAGRRRGDPGPRPLRPGHLHYAPGGGGAHGAKKVCRGGADRA